MLRIKEITVEGVKKFALLRLQENGSYTELGVYARNAYAVKKAKSVMSETKEVIECKFNGVLDVWKLQDDELVSTESDQMKRFDQIVALHQKAEQERNFRHGASSENLSHDISTVQTNSPEQTAFQAVGEVLYLVHKANSIMDFINGAKRIDVVRDEVWGYEPESWAQGCSADRRNALCACAVAGQPRSPPLG